MDEIANIYIDSLMLGNQLDIENDETLEDDDQ